MSENEKNDVEGSTSESGADNNAVARPANAPQDRGPNSEPDADSTTTVSNPVSASSVEQTERPTPESAADAALSSQTPPKEERFQTELAMVVSNMNQGAMEVEKLPSIVTPVSTPGETDGKKSYDVTVGGYKSSHLTPHSLSERKNPNASWNYNLSPLSGSGAARNTLRTSEANSLQQSNIATERKKDGQGTKVTFSKKQVTKKTHVKLQKSPSKTLTKQWSSNDNDAASRKKGKGKIRQAQQPRQARRQSSETKFDKKKNSGRQENWDRLDDFERVDNDDVNFNASPANYDFENQNESHKCQDLSANGTVNQPYGGPMWMQPKGNRDGRVGQPLVATAEMYGLPGPGRYDMPQLPDAPESTKRRFPTHYMATDLRGADAGSIGAGPAGHDHDPLMTRYGRVGGPHFLFKDRLEEHPFITPPPYDPTAPSIMKHHVTNYSREPYWSIRQDQFVRVGSYVPGPNYYPITRFPSKQIYKTPQKGPNPVVAHKPDLFGPYVCPVGPNQYMLPPFGKTRHKSNAPSYSMRPLRPMPLISRSPGPAAHSLKSYDTHRKRAPAYTFGISGTPYIAGAIASPKTGGKVCDVPPKHGGFLYGKKV